MHGTWKKGRGFWMGVAGIAGIWGVSGKWIWAQCPVQANALLPDTVCEDVLITPVNLSVIPAGTDTIVIWEWGDGSPADSTWEPSHSYSAGGTYVITLIVVDTVNNCSDTFQHTIVVTNVPDYALWDGQNLPSTSPEWVFCKAIGDPDSAVVNFQPVQTIPDSFILDFGDGTSVSGPFWDSTTIISHTYDSIGVYTVTLTVYDSASGCMYVLIGRVYNLRNPVAGIIGPPSGTQTGCAPHTVCFINNSTNIDTTTIFIWDFGDGTVDTFPASNAGDTVCHTYTDDYCNGTVTLIAQNRCAQTFTAWGFVDILGPDSAVIGASATVLCWPDSQVTFSNLSVSVTCDTVQRLFYWDFGNGQTYGWTPSTAPITVSYPGPGVYTVMLVDSNTCGTDTAYLTVRIDSPPAASFVPVPDSVCLGDTIWFVNTSDSTAVLFQWDFGNGQFLTTGSWNPIPVVYGWQGAFVVRMRARNATGCWSDWFVDTVWVLPLPNAAFNFWPNPAGCPPATINLNNFSWNANEFFWDFGDGDTSTLQNPGTHTYDSGGVYTIMLVAGNGVCYDTAYATVTVYPEPEARIILPDSFCVNVAVPISDSSTIDSGYSIISWWWDFGDGHTSNSAPPLSHTYTSPGQYVVTLVVNSNTNCPDTARDTITIIPDPFVQITAVPDRACDSLLVTIVDSVSGAVSFLWDLGNGDTSTLVNPSPVLYDSPGVYIITLTVYGPGGCSSQARDTVIVDPSPVATFIAPDSICQGQTITLSASASSPSGTPLSYTWYFGNGDSATGNPVSYTYLTPDTYVITLVVRNQEGCLATDTEQIVVHPGPVALFTPDTSTGCDSLVVLFMDSSLNAITWYWDFGNGDTFSGPNPPPILYDTPGTYIVTLTVGGTGGCTGVRTDTITVYETPQPSFLMPDTLCWNDTLVITNTTSGGTPPVSYEWIFSTGDTFYTTAPPPYLFPAPGDYAITLYAIASGMCGDSVRDSIRIQPIPTAQFSMVPDSGCELLTVVFQDSSQNAISYQWDFGNGNTDTTSTPPAQIYSAGTYIITLTVTNSLACSHTFRDTLMVFPLPVASMTFPDSVCAYNSVTFQSTSSVPAPSMLVQWQWYFGNGDSATGPQMNYTYNDSGIYQVTLIVTTDAGCRDTVVDSIWVFPSALAKFTVHPQSSCGPFVATFADSSLGATSWFWDFGNGNTFSGANPPPQSYTNPGMYVITLTVSNPGGCSSSAMDTVYVYAIPQAGFTFDDSVCVLDTVQFTDLSTIAWGTITDWTWYFGNGDSAIIQHPAYVYTDTGMYTVTLIVSSSAGCSDTLTDTIEVFPGPVAKFSIVPDAGCDSVLVTITDSSYGAMLWQWNLGNGNTFSGPNPPPQWYIGQGQYVITLTVTSPGGCSHTARDTVYVYTSPDVDFVIPDSICEQSQIQFVNQTTFSGGLNLLTWYWDFGTGDTSSLYQPIYLYDTAGVFPVTLIATTPDGCADTLTRTLIVRPKPTAQFGFAPPVGCDSIQVIFTDSSSVSPPSSIVQWFWDFGNGNTHTGPNPPPQDYINHTIYDTFFLVTLVVVTGSGCSDTLVDTVVVKGLPDVDFTFTPPAGCGPLSVQFTNQSQPPSSTFVWTIPGFLQDTTVHLTTTFPPAYTIPDTYQVILTATTPTGCTASKDTYIVVYPEPEVAFSIVPDSGCHPLQVCFLNQTTGGAFFTWFLPETVLTTPSPCYTFTNTGTTDSVYLVGFTAISPFGCVGDTVYAPVNVWPLPVASVIPPDTLYWPNATVSIPNLSSQGNAFTYIWIWGDGTADTTAVFGPGVHTYPSWGVYEGVLIVKTPECQDTVVFQVVILPPLPIPILTLSPTRGCEPLTVSFLNQSLYADSLWLDYGDGTGTESPNPAPHTYWAGVYTVALYVWNDAGDSALVLVDTIVVYPRPEARAQCLPDTVYVPGMSVTCMEQATQEATLFWWDWGDGSSPDTGRVVHHIYTREGEYLVTLIASSPQGCLDTAYYEVTAIGSGKLHAPTAFTPDGDGINDEFYIKGLGVEYARLMIFDRWGQLVWEGEGRQPRWDGTHIRTGEPCLQDVYVWRYTGRFVTGERFDITGYVLLIR